MNASARFVILLVLLCCVPVQAEERLPDNVSILSMPVVETEEIIKNWLTRNGYHPIYSHKQKNDMVVEAWRDGQPWRIALSAYTPLATRIRTESSKEDSPHRGASLREYLEGYVNQDSPTSVTGIVEIPQAVRDHLEAIVCIYAEKKDGPLQLSGFCLDREGVVLTTGHGLSLGQVVRVEFFDGHGSDGRVVKLDSQRDLSLIKVPERLPAVIPLRNGRYAPGLDERLFSVGCPQGKSATINLGRLEGPPRRVEGFPLWQAKIHIEPGSSGSPILDDRGRLTAVIKGRYRGTDALGFLIPFETLLYFMEKY